MTARTGNKDLFSLLCFRRMRSMGSLLGVCGWVYCFLCKPRGLAMFFDHSVATIDSIWRWKHNPVCVVVEMAQSLSCELIEDARKRESNTHFGTQNFQSRRDGIAKPRRMKINKKPSKGIGYEVDECSNLKRLDPHDAKCGAQGSSIYHTTQRACRKMVLVGGRGGD